MQAYCFKCRKKVEIRGEHMVVLKNARISAQGVCPECGTKVVRMTGKV